MEENTPKNEKSGLKNFPTHSRNPYIPLLKIPSRNKTVTIASQKDWALVNTETGEENGTFLAIREKIDKEEFVKIYKAQIQSIFNLSPSGIRLFGYFMESLEINSDILILDIKEVCKYTGYKTRPPIYKAIAELLENQFIAKTSKPNVFYINPAIFFNGKRFTLIKDYEIENRKFKVEE